MKKINVFVLSVLLLFTFFYLNELLCNYWITLGLINSYNNTPYNENALVFIISSPDTDTIDLKELEQKNYLSGCVLLKYNNGNYKLNEVLYCADGVIGIKGLEKLEFNSGEKIAVAGIDSGYSIGANVFENGNTYSVCGLLEKHISNAVNTGIFYSNNDLSHVPTECTYVLTSKDKDMIAIAYANLETLAESKNAKLKNIEVENVKFSDYVNYEGTAHILFFVLAVFYVLLIYLFRYIWIKIKSPEIFILNILGVSNNKIRIQTEYFITWFLSYLLSLVIFFISIKDKCYDCKTIVIFATCILTIAFFSVIDIYKVNKYIL